MKAAIYCRLSVEDEDRGSSKCISESIQNQQLLLLDYAKKHDYELFAIYVDEDYSGLDSSRPAFVRMLADAQAGYFQVILCKTQSRFTRDMELVERYLHHLFPLWGIRFIGIVDGVDTAERHNKKARQITGLINEWYCEDLSDNIRAVFQKKMQDGQFIGSFACYGYKKDPTDHHRLVIDEPAAQIVQRIYQLYLSGTGVTSIARQLTTEQIPPPSIYKQMQGLKFHSPRSSVHWSVSTIKNILKNPTYTGTLVQGKEKKLSYKSKKMIHLPPECWIRIPGTHPAIISEEDFQTVQNQLQLKKRKKFPKKDAHILSLSHSIHCK